MSFRVEVKGTEFLFGKLDDLVNAPRKEAKNALRETGDLLIKEFSENFDSNGSRINGKQWKPLKQKTLEQKLRLGYGSKPILVRTGRLRKGFVKNVFGYSVRVTNKTKYYRYHQLGEGFNPVRTMVTSSRNLEGDILEIFNIMYRNIINKK